MTLRLFEGPAGSGKTTRLFNEVRDRLCETPIAAEQSVLALTKIHGSRRRMQAKLFEVLGKGTASECVTLNSFALSLVDRWRSLARRLCDPIPPPTDFSGLASLAARLLAGPRVVAWVAARHPLLVVDELQDLRGDELAVIRGLASGIDVLCAADEFQDLSPNGVCEGVAWARGIGETVVLHTIHRTDKAGLLAAARAIRGGAAPSHSSPGFRVFAAPNANVAAGYMARNLTWWGGSQVVVLSPTGPNSSPFVSDALDRLRLKAIKAKDGEFGPFSVPWEEAASDELARWAALLRLDRVEPMISATEILEHQAVLPGPLIDWVTTRGRLAGTENFPVSVVRDQIGRAQSLLRGYGRQRRFTRGGLTIHQAKNREFERAIVLWPFKIGGGQEVHRRLLYNAVTRAKHDCVVLVQDPKPQVSRLTSPPFG